MNTRTRYSLVGLFVLGLGGALIAGILWLSTGGQDADSRRYVVYMTDSVAGLNRDSAVTYRGVNVGRVREISLAPDDPERVRLLLEVQKDTPIRTDTVATLEMQGLTGLGSVNLTGGSQDAPPLTASKGEDYPVIPSRPSLLGRLDRRLTELADNLIVTSQGLRSLLNDDNRALLIDTLTNLKKITDAVASRSDKVGEALDNMVTTLDNARDASADLPALVKHLKGSAVALEAMANEMADAGNELRDSLRARGQELSTFTGSALPEAALMTQELRRAAENLRRFTESLQRNPSVLLRGTPPPQPGPGE